MRQFEMGTIQPNLASQGKGDELSGPMPLLIMLWSDQLGVLDGFLRMLSQLF